MGLKDTVLRAYHLFFAPARALWSRSKGQSNADRINELSEKRLLLCLKRDKIYEVIEPLEKKDAELLARGKLVSNKVLKRRIASQLVQVRHDTARQNQFANMYVQQIDILSASIHNLTLIEHNSSPTPIDKSFLSEEEVINCRIQVEELLEKLDDNAALVKEFNVGPAILSEAEQAIMKEFEQEEIIVADLSEDDGNEPVDEVLPVPGCQEQKLWD